MGTADMSPAGIIWALIPPQQTNPMRGHCCFSTVWLPLQGAAESHRGSSDSTRDITQIPNSAKKISLLKLIGEEWRSVTSYQFQLIKFLRGRFARMGQGSSKSSALHTWKPLADIKFADVKALSVTTWITWVHQRVINTEFSRKRERMSIAERESF